VPINFVEAGILDNEFILFNKLKINKEILEMGDKGVSVAVVQRKLQDLGYYNSTVDGVYGKGTFNAIKAFQKDNNLKPDGVVGNETYDLLTSDKVKLTLDFTEEDLIYLARTIHAESRGESLIGKIGVGAVVLNRVESKHYPNTVKEVVKQKSQFEVSSNNTLYTLTPNKESIQAAFMALIGYDPTYNSIYFYNPKTAKNLSWTYNIRKTVKLGNHQFGKR
jgi:N-acetylmuramoyl-L-alanine amidase